MQARLIVRPQVKFYIIGNEPDLAANGVSDFVLYGAVSKFTNTFDFVISQHFKKIL